MLYFGAYKNHLIVTVLLSTHTICFGLEMRQLITWYALITKALIHAIVNCYMTAIKDLL